ncbi:MAG: RNA methyltransferase [Bacteroidia bacterium]
MVSKSQEKWLRQLQGKKFRDKFQLFIAEGHKTVAELLQSSLRFDKLFATENWLRQKGKTFQLPQDRIVEVSPVEMKAISSFITPPEVLAVFPIPELPELWLKPELPYILLDNLRDPGNLGTIIRTADWFGIPAIICSPGCADCFNPKAIQASMGSIARLPVYYHDLVRLLTDHPAIPSYACTIQGVPLSQDKPKGGFFIIGNEAHGLTESLLAKCRHQITIPGSGHAESLNAAIAAAIMMYEVSNFRQ